MGGVDLRRFVGTLAVLCALSLLISLPVIATDYTPTYYTYSLYASGETYSGYLDGSLVSGALGRSNTGSFTIPLDLDSRFRWVNIGANYGTVTYDVGASYKFVLTLTLGTTGSIISTVAPILYTAPRLNGFAPPIDISSQTLISQKGVVESVGSGSWTITYDNIPYDSVVGNNFYYVTCALKNFDSAIDTDLYVVSSYFGLMSNYDDDAYKSQILDGLNGIQGSIEDGNNKLDGIHDSLNNQYESDKNKAEDDLNGASGEVDDAISTLPDYSDNYMSILGDLENAMMTTETTSTIPLPNGKVNILGHSVDIFAGHTEVNVSEILSNPDIQTLIRLGKGFSVLFTMGICVYWVYAIYSWFNGLGPEPEIPIVDPAFSSKTDPWGVKWR